MYDKAIFSYSFLLMRSKQGQKVQFRQIETKMQDVLSKVDR